MLTGSNFLPDSKVVFIERGPGEYPFWEEELGTGRVNSLSTSKWSLNFLICKMETIMAVFTVLGHCQD